MILFLTRYTARLALEIRAINNHRISDPSQLQLLIMPGELNDCPKHNVMGSPWFLSGCWPYHPTGIDLANPKLPDFPVLAYDAFDTDDEGRIVFIFDQRLWSLPDGRYTGVLRIKPIKPPINFPREIPKLNHIYTAQSHYLDNHRLAPCDFIPQAFEPPEPVCILTTFDIDLGPRCAEHMVSQAQATFTRSDCELEGDNV